MIRKKTNKLYQLGDIIHKIEDLIHKTGIRDLNFKYISTKTRPINFKRLIIHKNLLQKEWTIITSFNYPQT